MKEKEISSKSQTLFFGQVSVLQAAFLSVHTQWYLSH